MTTIVVEEVDLTLLNEQRKQLHELLLANFFVDGQEEGNLWGLLEMLDYICDIYNVS